MRTSVSTGGGFVSRLGADMAGSTEKVILPYRRQAGLRNRVNRTFALMTLKGIAGREKNMRNDRINLARDRQGGGGFSLIEILVLVVILGVLGAIVLPKFSDASNVTRENTLKDDLRYARTQIIVFKAQHGNTAPGYPGGKHT